MDGLPLAIELAAARVAGLDPAEIASHLDDVFTLLPQPARRADGAQRSLHATVEWSYALLGDEERRLLRRMGVFAGRSVVPVLVARPSYLPRSAMKIPLSISLLVTLTLCGACDVESPETARLCEQASTHVEACTGQALDELLDDCDGDKARELLEADCTMLQDFAAAGDKSDGRIGWREYGERCMFNFECEDELICAPKHLDIAGSYACFARSESEFCDSNADCLQHETCVGRSFFYSGRCEP